MKLNNLQAISPISETLENRINIGIATTSDEKQEIYRLRYQIYIEEMSQTIEDADYANKLLYDDLDEWGYLLYAKAGSEIIAAARINIGVQADFPENIVQSLSLNKFQNYNNINSDPKFSFCSKLTVAPAHRGSQVVYLLIAKCYELSYHNQVQFAFTSCAFYLLPLYEQMGFHRYCKNFKYPGFGILAPVVFNLSDIQHLRMVRSPLFRIARKKEVLDMRSIDWFRTTFTNHSHHINSQLVTEEELWSILCTRLTYPPNEAISILRNLSVAEAKRFLHCCGILVQCDMGDIITSQGTISYAYNILISGRLRSLTFLRPVKEYTLPGQHFGVNGLTKHHIHTEDIVVTDTSEILVLSGLAFQKFFHACPEIAHKITQNCINLNKNNRFNSCV